MCPRRRGRPVPDDDKTAASRIGASYDTVPSIMATSDGWTIRRTNCSCSQRAHRPSAVRKRIGLLAHEMSLTAGLLRPYVARRILAS